MRKRVPLPSSRFLRECLNYDAQTGILRWKVRPVKHFKDARAANSWNTRYAGQLAFHNKNKFGHFTGRVNDQPYLAHRVIWKIVTGKEPPVIIDHKDRCADNNKWDNFRSATKSQNNMNSDIPRGIWFDTSRNKFMAHIKKDRRRIFLGRFDKQEDAQAARRDAEIKLFGEFAP